MKKYATPVLRCYGSLLSRTSADFTTTSSDGIFSAQAQVGTATGSLDACIFGEGPPPPGATCGA